MDHMTSLGDKISVCLLTFNHVNLIESSIRTVLDQTIQRFEFVVSDDRSTDGTWEKILDLAKSNPRIKAIQTPHNMGMPGNTNFAVSQTSRPYIALLHHDDLYRQDLLEKWVGVMDRHPDVGFVFNSYGVFDSDYIYEHSFKDEKLDGRWFLEKLLFPRWGCPVRGTALIRRDAFVNADGMREEFGLLADIDLWMRLARNNSVGYIAEPVIIVRHDRPVYYPDIYAGNVWSWKRQRFLYEIHGINREEYYSGIRRVYEIFRYRFRVTMETIKWLGYAVVRNKPDMLIHSGEGASNYELPAVMVVRFIAKILRVGIIPGSRVTI
jgi:glycosyltransferase involved in cell wall biosynthesis